MSFVVSDTNRSLERIKAFCIASSTILIIPPSFVWGHSYVSIISLLLMLIALSIQILHNKKILIKPYLFIYLLYHAYINIIRINDNLTFVSSPFILSLLLLIFDKRALINAFYSFVKILSLLILISMAFYLLNILGVYDPSFRTLEMNGRDYNLYFFNSMFAEYKYDKIFALTGFYRFQAFFDEPGFLGTISALIVCVYKFNFKRNPFLYIYLIASFLSMSLASYLTLFVGAVFLLDVKKIIKFSIPLMIIGALNFQFIDSYIFSRFNTGKEESFIKDNRTSQKFDEEWNNYILTSQVFFGKGVGQHALIGDGTSSWKSIVYNSGIIGLCLYISVLLSISFCYYYKKKDMYYFVVFILFLITIYHRPNVLSLHYLMIYLGGIISFSRIYRVEAEN